MSKQFTVPPFCNDTRECFGILYLHGGFRACKALCSTYEHDGECPFCKPDAEVTDGIRYPKISYQK